MDAGADQFDGEACPELLLELLAIWELTEARLDDSARTLRRHRGTPRLSRGGRGRATRLHHSSHEPAGQIWTGRRGRTRANVAEPLRLHLADVLPEAESTTAVMVA